VPPNTL